MDAPGIRRVAGSPYVFCHSDGRPYQQIQNGIRAAFERAGVMAGKAKRVHYFRHTFATELVEREKVDPFTLQDLLGHSRIETTKRYTHPRPEYKRKVVEALPFALRGTKVAPIGNGTGKVIALTDRKAIVPA
jgi:site-specific recombinase XerD